MKNNIEFPELDEGSLVFGQIPDQKEWEEKAKNAGFKYMNNNIYSEYAMELFYNGGELPKKKKEISEKYFIEGLRLFKCWLGSWKPKHERKEEVTGYILFLISDEKWIIKKLKKLKKR